MCQYALNADRDDNRGDKEETVGKRLSHPEDLISALAQKTVPKYARSTLKNAEDRFVPSAETWHDNLNIRSHDHVASGSNTEALGYGAFHPTQASYVDASHWSSILESIREIRQELLSSDPQIHASVKSSSAINTSLPLRRELQVDLGLNLGSTEMLSLEGVLKGLPSRQICDKLVSRYFHSQYKIMRKH